MLIENTGVGVIAFGMQGPKLKNNAAGRSAAMTSVKPLIAIPGVNHIDDKAWDEIAKNPSVQHWIEEGRIKVFEPATAAQKKELAKDRHPSAMVHPHFEGMTEKQAVALIKKTMFLPLLKEWIEGDNRPKVVHNIQEQMKVCGPTEVKKSEE